MNIGIDFDNTIVDYRSVFYKIALKLNWIIETPYQSKSEVKSYFIEKGEEEKWTELQGLVYGTYISVANPYDGVLETISQFLSKHVDVYVISHKTRYPYIGKKTDLHDSARNWMSKKGLFNLIPPDKCYFLETKEEKVNKIQELDCAYFIDDLVSVLEHPLFPSACKKILFNRVKPEMSQDITWVKSWFEISEIFNEFA